MPWTSFKIYFELNVEVLQESTAILAILHSLKGLITTRRIFQRTIKQQLGSFGAFNNLNNLSFKFQ